MSLPGADRVRGPVILFKNFHQTCQTPQLLFATFGDRSFSCFLIEKKNLSFAQILLPLPLYKRERMVPERNEVELRGVSVEWSNCRSEDASTNQSPVTSHQLPEVMEHYFALMASTGSKFAALCAGKYPDTNPMNTDTPKPNTMLLNERNNPKPIG